MDMAFLVTRRFADDRLHARVPGVDDGPQQAEGEDGYGDARGW